MAEFPARGLYAISPDVDSDDTDRWLGRIEAALRGGAAVLQYRDKRADRAERVERARALHSLTRRHDVPLIINDHVSLAADTGADGVHLGADDNDVASARAILGDDAIIGVSCYADLARAERAAADGADYLAFGSVATSATKPGAVPCPWSTLGEARRFGLPVVAIGGITMAVAGDLVAAGATHLAVIGGLFDADDIAARAQAFNAVFRPRD